MATNEGSQDEFRDRETWERLVSEAIAEAGESMPGWNFTSTKTYDDLPLVGFTIDNGEDGPDDREGANRARVTLEKALQKRGLVPGGMINEKYNLDEVDAAPLLVGEDLERFGSDALGDAVAEAEAAVPGTQWIVDWPGGGDLTNAKFGLIWDRDVGGEEAFVRAHDAFRRALARRGLASPHFFNMPGGRDDTGDPPISSVDPDAPSPSFRPVKSPSIRSDLVESVVADYLAKGRERKASRERRSPGSAPESPPSGKQKRQKRRGGRGKRQE